MAMAIREDEHKIFLGSLNNDINKPTLLTLLAGMGLQPYDVIVPTVRPGNLGIAFVIFWTTLECQNAIEMLHGAMDPACSPGAMTAHRGDPSGESLGL